MTDMKRPDAPQVTRGASRRKSSLFARGESMVWLTGAALVISIAMIVGLLAIVTVRGSKTFWPQQLKRVETVDGRALMGELTKTETFRPEPHVFESIPDAEQRATAEAMVARNGGRSERRFIRTGNRSPDNRDGFHWVQDFQVVAESSPEWALTVERTEWGRFYGTLEAFAIGEERTASTPAEAWTLYDQHHEDAVELWDDAAELDEEEIGAIDGAIEKARLRVKGAELDHGAESSELEAAQRAFDAVMEHHGTRRAELRAMVDAMRTESGKYALVLRTAEGEERQVRLVDIVRAYPANQVTCRRRCGRHCWWRGHGSSTQVDQEG